MQDQILVVKKKKKRNIKITLRTLLLDIDLINSFSFYLFVAHQKTIKKNKRKCSLAQSD